MKNSGTVCGEKGLCAVIFYAVKARLTDVPRLQRGEEYSNVLEVRIIQPLPSSHLLCLPPTSTSELCLLPTPTSELHPLVTFPTPSLSTSLPRTTVKHKPLSKLPRELVLDIADPLLTSSLSRLLRTCPFLHLLLTSALTSRITTEHLASEMLLYGIQPNFLPTVHLALTHNADWHTFTSPWICSSAILEACKLGRYAIITTLISHYVPKIFIDKGTNNRYCCQSPLDYALRSNDKQLRRLLLKCGAPLNRISPCWLRMSSLTVAAKYWFAEIVHLLIMYGAEIRFDSSSLYEALRHKKWYTAVVLLRVCGCAGVEGRVSVVTGGIGWQENTWRGGVVCGCCEEVFDGSVGG